MQQLGLEDRKRALRLVNGMKHYDLLLKDQSGNDFSIPQDYFVTEWIDNDVDNFFYDSNNYGTNTKISLFRSIVLALQTIHSEGLFHRDLKIDNIRLKASDPEFLSIIIDFGTAASIDSENLKSPYTSPVGAPAFAAPECFVGLAADRSSCQRSDLYSLGTLLFDLFAIHPFHIARSQQTSFDAIIWAIQQRIAGAGSVEAKLAIWAECMRDFRYRTDGPEFGAAGARIPPSILPILSTVYECLTKFDFQERDPCFKKLIARVDSALKIHNNEDRYQKKLKLRRQQRQ